MKRRMIHGSDELREEILEATATAHTLVDGLSSAQFNWKPTPGKWSIGECIDHITTTNEAYNRKFQRVFGADGLPSGEPPWKLDLVGRFFLAAMEPPIRAKVKAPPRFLPSESELEREEVMRRFEQTQSAIIDLLESHRDTDLARVKVTSPVAKWLRFNAAAALAILASHERRHLWQAAQIPHKEGFPDG